jgi:hypothetical protein
VVIVSKSIMPPKEFLEAADRYQTGVFSSRLTTAGAGDLAAIHPIARSLTNIEAMIGQLYPATLLARLVTLEIEGEKR